MSIETSANHTHEQWRSIAQRELAATQTKFFIDGDYRDAVDGGRFETINPANMETIAAVSAANAKDVDAAVAAARKAFRSGSWSDMSPRARMDILYRFTQLIDDNAEQLAVLDTLDRVISSDLTVLVVGESGTGKELIARALHYNGPRRSARPYAAGTKAGDKPDRVGAHRRVRSIGLTSRRPGVTPIPIAS